MSEAVVVDACLAVKWVIVEGEDDTDKAVALYREWIARGVTILAPALLPTEAASVVYTRVRRGNFTIDEARSALAALLTTDIAVIHDPSLSMRALELTHTHHLPSTYDGHYLALAEREGCTLWTADRRLWNSVSGSLVWVRYLANYTPSAAADPQ